MSKYGVFSGPYFSIFGLNAEISQIQENTKKTPYLDNFHAVIIFGYQWSISEKILMEMVLSMMLSIEDASLTYLELTRAIKHIRFFIMSNTNTNLPVWLNC